MRELERKGMGVKFDGWQLHHLRFAHDITWSITQAERMLADFDRVSECAHHRRYETRIRNRHDAVPVLRSTYVPIKVTSDYDDIFRRYLCCLLIKQAPKVFFGLVVAATLRNIRRGEVMESLLSGDNNLHQPIVIAFNAYNRVTKSFGDDYSDTTGGPWAAT
ncbi:unnamed protein product [Heligmosomoides polygyrus]|uniref:Reverse transcriptase domain-containing protein n=1 Tax=Heligmosomoides polygyrus TaxID=6339 RepID=A0A183G4C7_HELPZ|nr:unnamed protein product [Heligmosomoides polygyrus]